jgi:hypothetical protein
MEFGFFYDSPIWLISLLIFLVYIAALEIGYRIALWQREKWKDADSGGGNVVLTSSFALLGLILAFTYAAGISRHEVRKQAVISEANALGTTYLRARLVGEPGRTELRKALLEYARTLPIKQGVLLTPAERGEILRKMQQAQASLWPLVEGSVMQGKPGAIEASLITATNDLLDEHTVRLAAAYDKLPPAVVWMLVLIAAACLALTGFNAGLSGRMSRWRMTVFAAILTGVSYMIVDFDRPTNGLIQVSQVSLKNVIADIEADLDN